jgi:peptidyl-prolyl cis-trans isomerase B (cyclophilin B)
VNGRPSKKVPAAGMWQATLLTDQGALVLALDATAAPCTVNSFAFLASARYFSPTRCTRLATDLHFLECGSPAGPGYAVPEENLAGASYPRGTVAMVNRGPGTNGSAFFLVAQDSPLPPSFTPFGTITRGLDLLDRVVAAGSLPPSDGTARMPLTISTVVVTRPSLTRAHRPTP